MTTTFRTAIRDALDEALADDDRVILFGEDVAVAGGVFATTTGLHEKYGPERVFDTPISELASVGAAVSPPAPCSVIPPRQGMDIAGRMRAWQSRRSPAESMPPIAFTSAMIEAAISPS